MLNIIDCTFRDGGYYNNWRFDISLIKKYIAKFNINTKNNLYTLFYKLLFITIIYKQYFIYFIKYISKFHFIFTIMYFILYNYIKLRLIFPNKFIHIIILKY